MVASQLAEGAEGRLELLRSVNLELARQGDPRALLSSALALLLPDVCQQVLLDIYELDGKHTFVTAFADPELERLAHEIGRRYPPASGGPAAERAVRNEVILREVSDTLLGSVARDSEHLSLLRRFEATELCLVWVRMGGRVHGLLLLGTDHGRRFTTADRTFVEVLAERLAAHLGWVYFPFAARAPVEDTWLRWSGARRPGAIARRATTLVDSALLGLFEWNAAGVISDANATFLRLSGRSERELSSRSLRVEAVLPPALAPEPLPAESSPPAGRVVLERELLTPAGARVPVLFGQMRLPEAESWLGFVLDVTEQRQRAELEAMLLGMVSHDLRNPLGVVTMAASLLLSQDLTAAQRKLASRIEAAGRKTARLISDLLDFTIARRTGIVLSPEPRDLHAVVAQAVDDLNATWPERTVVHERVGEATAHLDQARVEQMAANLIGNALQHSPTTTLVRVETRGDADTVSFSVCNAGPPIPEELMAQLFSPLRRGDNAGHRRGSIGLGLFIVHQLVLAHGGTIEARSNEAEGTRFTVRLPRTRQQIRAREATRERCPGSSSC